jgi:acyl-CoA thioesterase I
MVRAASAGEFFGQEPVSMRLLPLGFAIVLVGFLVSASESAEPASATAGKLCPFWRSTTMEGESVLFIKDKADTPPRAALLFKPTRILSVSTSSGETTYQEGRDYVWRPGTNEIVLPAGSRIVFKTPQDMRRPAKSQRYALTHRDGNGEIFFGGGHEYHDLQTVVSYEHARAAWAGPMPAFAGDQLPRTIQKLTNKQPLTIALLGDSISTGCNASGWAKVAPFQLPYQDLLVRHLEAVYGSKVTLKNFAVGGTDTAWGLANIGKVIEAQPDLAILAFGMNDAAGRPAASYQTNMQAMVDAVRKARPDAEVILVATMLGNKDWTTLHQELFPQYRDALARLCGSGIVLADLTSVWAELLKHKQDWDLTGNGVNHPNDFGHRVYAQVLASLLTPDAAQD